MVKKKSNAAPRQDGLISYYVVEKGKDKVLKTKGFREMGRKELVLSTTDIPQGIRVLSMISDRILSREVQAAHGAPVHGIVAVPLYFKDGILDGEPVFYLVSRM
jgi:hypothetical protein